MAKQTKLPTIFAKDIIVPANPSYMPDYGNAGAKEGTDEHRLWQHLQLYTNTPVFQSGGLTDTHCSVEFQWKLEAWERQLHAALDADLWKYMKDAEGNLFRTFKRYLRYPQPWGLGLGKHFDFVMEMLRTYCPTKTTYSDRGEATHTCIADRIDEAVQDGRDDRERNADGTFSTDSSKQGGTPPNGSDKRSDDEAKQARAIARAPVTIRHLHTQGLLSKELAAKFGPFCNSKPTTQQQEKADQVAAAAADIARFVDENPVPPYPGKDMNAYKARLRGMATERLSLAQTTVKISLKSAETAAALLRKKADKRFIAELIALLQEGA